jgi:PAS domain S-box-containing protein
MRRDTKRVGDAVQDERGRPARPHLGDEQVRALLWAVPDLVFLIGADGVYHVVKVEDEEDLVAAPEQLVGSSVHDVLPPAVADAIMECAGRVLASGGVETIEYELVLSGLPRVFEGRLVACSADEFLLMVRDFTEQRRQESELRRLAEELEERVTELGRERDFTHTVVRSVPSFLALVDAGGCLLGLNDSLERATGYSSDEAQGRPFWEALMPEQEWEAARRLHDAAGAGEQPLERELRLVASDGRELVVEWTGTPVLDQHALTRTILCGVDVTERVRQRQELRRSRARIVEAADAERRRLERNLHDGAQQQLVAVSHALRLARPLLEDDPARAAELLDTAVETLHSTHEELRELARGLHPALLTERGLDAALRAVARRSPVEVELDVCEERFPAPIETAAYYVVAEALTNVAKYAAATRACVRVAVEQDHVVVEVRDDGVGGADPLAGTGLPGLGDRVEALGGTFWVESPRGKGTLVRAVLPRA